MSPINGTTEARQRVAAVPWAVILAGGLGTRLRPLVNGLPKVMAPVWGRPFLSFVLNWLQCQGITKAVLCTGYLGRVIENYYGRRFGRIQIFYSREKELLGTGGALGPAASMVESENMLVLNGDSLCLANLDDFIGWHAKKGAAASLVACKCRDTRRFGAVIAAEDDRVVGFEEKAAQTVSALINAGIYLFKTSLFTRLEGRENLSLERDILPRLVGRGLFAYRCEAAFIDIGIPRDYLKAAEFFEDLPSMSGIGGPADGIFTLAGQQS